MIFLWMALILLLELYYQSLILLSDMYNILWIDDDPIRAQWLYQIKELIDHHLETIPHMANNIDEYNSVNATVGMVADSDEGAIRETA